MKAFFYVQMKKHQLKSQFKSGEHDMALEFCFINRIPLKLILEINSNLERITPLGKGVLITGG